MVDETKFRESQGASARQSSPSPPPQAAAPPPTPQAQTIRMLRATVAHGHTIDVPLERRITIGLTPEGKAITQLVTKSFGPGQEVELPADEVAWLRSTGHLVDPNKVASVVDDGSGAGAREIGRKANEAGVKVSGGDTRVGPA